MNGKTFGTIAFIITEIIVVLGSVGIIIGLINHIDVGVPAAGILTLQGAVFTATWGAVATKNFRSKE